MSKFRLLKWIFFFLPLVISMGPCQFQSTCRTSTAPDDPINPPEIVRLGWVVYRREVPVRAPQLLETVAFLLVNEGRATSSPYTMEKTDDNEWKAYVPEQIIANYPSQQGSLKFEEHIAYVVDKQLWDGTPDPTNDYSKWTGYGIYIFEQRVSQIETYHNGTRGKFRVDKDKKLY